MQLMLPLIGLFIYIGLSQRSMTRRVYIRMLGVILIVLGYYFVTMDI